MQHDKKLFITIEGIDGCGKTSLTKNLAKSLSKKGICTLATKEPGGTIASKELRKILQTQQKPLCYKAEFLLFAADRAQHFSDVIIPALKKEIIVISDRSADSSVAYQGYGRGESIDMIKSVNKWVTQGVIPDITFYIKIDIETALSRVDRRKKILTTFEKETKLFWERVLDGYEKIFAARKNVYTIDGTMNENAVLQSTIDILEKKL